jgi:hypothetical protein
MGQIAVGRKLGFSVAQAIGLPTENLVKLSLVFEPEKAVTCHAEYHVTISAGLNLTKILAKDYKIVKK